VVCEHVVADIAAVIIADDACEPNVTSLYKLCRQTSGWRPMGAGSVGCSWSTASQDGSRGVAAVGVATTPDVVEVRIEISGATHTVPVEAGYGVVVPDVPPSTGPLPCTYRTADRREVIGWPPPAHTFAKAADHARLTAIGDAQHFVWAAQLQIERYVAAIRTPTPRQLPATATQRRLGSMVFVEAEFMFNAAAQAEKALEVVGGPALSSKLAREVRLLRNLHEHSDEQRVTFEDPTKPRVLAGKSFAAAYPGEVPWTFGFGADGHFVSVLRIEDLWDELEDIDIELDRLWNAEIVGTSMSHVPGSEKRARRPLPVPAGDVLGLAALAQRVIVGDG
jgi:hypothetical protein